MATERDYKIMKLILDEAHTSYTRGNLPIGAAITIEDNIIGIGSNNQVTGGDWFSHAENTLIGKYASEGEECDDGNTDDTDFCLSTCEANPAFPTASQWGLVAMSLDMLAAGTIVVARRL